MSILPSDGVVALKVNGHAGDADTSFHAELPRAGFFKLSSSPDSASDAWGGAALDLKRRRRRVQKRNRASRRKCG